MKSNSYFCPQDFCVVVGKECRRRRVLPSASPCAHLDEAGCKHGYPQLLIFIALFIRKNCNLTTQVKLVKDSIQNQRAEGG